MNNLLQQVRNYLSPQTIKLLTALPTRPTAITSESAMRIIQQCATTVSLVQIEEPVEMPFPKTTS